MFKKIFSTPSNTKEEIIDTKKEYKKLFTLSQNSLNGNFWGKRNLTVGDEISVIPNYQSHNKSSSFKSSYEDDVDSKTTYLVVGSRQIEGTNPFIDEKVSKTMVLLMESSLFGFGQFKSNEKRNYVAFKEKPLFQLQWEQNYNIGYDFNNGYAYDMLNEKNAQNQFLIQDSFCQIYPSLKIPEFKGIFFSRPNFSEKIFQINAILPVDVFVPYELDYLKIYMSGEEIVKYNSPNFRIAIISTFFNKSIEFFYFPMRFLQPLPVNYFDV